MAIFSNPNLKSRMADSLEDIMAHVCAEIMPTAGSPIERTLFESLVTMFYVMTGMLPAVAKQRVLKSYAHWRITPQAQIGKFRVDFLIEVATYDLRVVVECDGRAYHERTKTQAKKDRSRDRDLQGMGYMVLRYTGSEIFADPWGCAFDIWTKVESRYPVPTEFPPQEKAA